MINIHPPTLHTTNLKGTRNTQLARQPNLTTFPLSTKTDKNKDNNGYSGNMKDADFKGNIKNLSYETLNAKHSNSQHYHNKEGYTPSPKFTNSSRHDSTHLHRIKPPEK